MAQCSRCNGPSDEQPLSTNWCRKCHREYQKLWRQQNPEKALAKDARARARLTPERKIYLAQLQTARRYGLTVEEYQRLLDVQTCAICCGSLVPKGEAFHKRPPIDHCHVTGKVRGVLCRQCNSMLGLAQDDPAILRAGADYIELHRKMTAM